MLMAFPPWFLQRLLEFKETSVIDRSRSMDDVLLALIYRLGSWVEKG